MFIVCHCFKREVKLLKQSGLASWHRKDSAVHVDTLGTLILKMASLGLPIWLLDSWSTCTAWNLLDVCSWGWNMDKTDERSCQLSYISTMTRDSKSMEVESCKLPPITTQVVLLSKTGFLAKPMPCLVTRNETTNMLHILPPTICNSICFISSGSEMWWVYAKSWWSTFGSHIYCWLLQMGL